MRIALRVAKQNRKPINLVRSLSGLHPEWGLISAIGVGLAAVWLTVAHGLPYGHDSSLHLYRLVERDYLIRQGLVFSRWSPVLGYGYGFPLYHYYPPLLYYLAEPFQLIGLGPLQALQIVLGLMLLSGAAGMYCWVRDIFGAGSAVVAATAFIFSPYMMYTLIDRAGFPEILVLTCMPWALWTFFHYANARSRIHGIATAVLLAATLLTHLISAYLLTATLLVYAAAISLATLNASYTRTSSFRLGWPIALGLGLRKSFWLPAMWEANLVQIDRVLQIADPSLGHGLMPFGPSLTSPVLPDTLPPVASVPPRCSG